MIYHFVDRQFNPIATVDSESRNGIIINNDTHTIILDPAKKTLLRELDMEIYKNSGPKDDSGFYISSLIKESGFVLFENEQNRISCLTIMAIEGEDEEIRPIHCEDIGMELINSEAAPFVSNKEQYIDYYVDRELYDTGWQIGINEIGTDVKKLGIFSENETSLERLQKICAVFNCEMTFEVELRNLKVYRKLVNIFQKIGTDRTDRVFYSGKDVVSIVKDVNTYDVVTALRDENEGFNDLVVDDGRFYTVAGTSIVYDRTANSEYGRGNTSKERFSGWIMGNAASSAKAPLDCFNELRNDLEVLATPSFSAKVDILFNGDEFQVGDWITFIDEEYNPPARIKARITKMTLDSSDKLNNEIEISNFQLLDSKISSDLLALQRQKNANNDTYQIELTTNNGSSFIEGQDKTTTITARIFKNGIDITSSIDSSDIVWYKQDQDGNNDEAWEEINKNATTTVTVSSTDFNEVSTISCAMLTLDNKYVKAIYFLNGLKNMARRIVRAQNDDIVTSIHISDTHFATDSAIRDDLENYGRSLGHIQNVVELTNFVDIDYVVLNGDVHDGGTQSKDVAIRNFRAMVSELGSANCPYFISWGNHDDNSWGDGRAGGQLRVPLTYKKKTTDRIYHGPMKNLIRNNEMYDLVTRPSTIFDIVENEDDKMGYFYYDVPNKNTRVIILNSSDTPNIFLDGYNKYPKIEVWGYRQKQITWFYNALKSVPAGYHVAVYQHCSFGYRYNPNQNYVAYNYEMIDGIVDAFVSGGTYSRTYSDNPDFAASISVNFNGVKGNLAFLAHGHHHTDRINVAPNGIVDYSISCSVSRPKKEQLDRPLGVLEEDLWDVVIMNKKTRKVDLLRFGAGSDRSFYY